MVLFVNALAALAIIVVVAVMVRARVFVEVTRPASHTFVSFVLLAIHAVFVNHFCEQRDMLSF